MQSFLSFYRYITFLFIFQNLLFSHPLQKQLVIHILLSSFVLIQKCIVFVAVLQEWLVAPRYHFTYFDAFSRLLEFKVGRLSRICSTEWVVVNLIIVFTFLYFWETECYDTCLLQTRGLQKFSSKLLQLAFTGSVRGDSSVETFPHLKMFFLLSESFKRLFGIWE